MSKKYEAHDLVSALKIIHSKLGRVPTMVEFTRDTGISDGSVRRRFGTWNAFIQAAGFQPYGFKEEKSEVQAKAEKKYKALCSKKEQIQGFFRHILDLPDLFERAGNPPSLKMMGLGDVHTKYLDPAAVHVTLQVMEWYRPHLTLIIGDFGDCEGISHWDSNTMEPKRLIPEMKLARKVLEAINAASPDAIGRIFCEGNHEHWIAQALLKMPELFEGLDELIDTKIDVQTLMGLEKYGWDFYPLNHFVKIGKLHFTHGLYTTSNHAKKHLDVIKADLEYGHLHDDQEHNQTSMEGSMRAGCMGCLCKLDALFLKGKPNNWVHKINMYEFFPDGSYNKLKPEIVNGKVSIFGKVFVGDPNWKP